MTENKLQHRTKYFHFHYFNLFFQNFSNFSKINFFYNWKTLDLGMAPNERTRVTAMLPKWFFLFSASFSPNILPFWEVHFLCPVGCPSPTTGVDTQRRVASLVTFYPHFFAHSSWSLYEDPCPGKVNLPGNDIAEN